MTYEELLNKAYEKLPKIKDTEERFEIPKAEILSEGNKTILKNFMAIAQTIRRESQHFFKFLTRQLATPGTIEGKRAIFSARLDMRRMQSKIELYVKQYVICKECGKPDTKLVKEGRVTLLKCEACGAKSNVS